MAAFPRSVNFRDAKNQTSTTRFYIPGPAGTDRATQLGAIGVAFGALTNASAYDNDNTAFAAVAGTNAAYPDVEDKAVLVFQTTAGSIHRYSIPAPKAAIFLADGETVDFTNADVIAAVAAVVGNIVSRDGGAMASAVGGYRRRSHTQRKFNIRTRNPTLTGQGL